MLTDVNSCHSVSEKHLQKPCQIFFALFYHSKICFTATFCHFPQIKFGSVFIFPYICSDFVYGESYILTIVVNNSL